jgi:putative endonuclease
MNSKFYVYIIQCANGQLYTGMTNDVERRFEEHRSGHGGHYTSYAGATKLLYKEEYNTSQEAAKRETQLKGWTRRKKIALMQNNLALLKKL